MPKRSILVGCGDKLTEDFLGEYFSETKSIPIFAKSKEDMSDALSLMKPDIIFAKAEWLDKPFLSHLGQYKQEKPAARIFSLGQESQNLFKWDGQFEMPLESKGFRKALLGGLSYPESVKLLVIDDEEGIIELFKDFFELQRAPVFKVETARDGLDGFRKMESLKPDCIVLDLKMPVRSGIEFYADMKKSNRDIPVIVFLDSTSPDEIAAVRKNGSPIFVEKSGQHSSMQEMLAIVKKLFIFA